MHRHILGYLPASVVPAVSAFAMVYVYTRLVSAVEFGRYNLILSAVLLAQTVFYFSLPVALLRFYPGAAQEARLHELLRVIYRLFWGITLTVAAGFATARLLFEMPVGMTFIAWFALPLLILRSAVLLNQAVNRASDAMMRYNVIESAHAVLGFLMGLAGLLAFGRTAEPLLLGLLISAAVCSLVDIRTMALALTQDRGLITGDLLMRLVRYVWPLTAVAISAGILQLSDRLLLGTLGPLSLVGIYAAGSNLVERPITVLCAAVNTATFSLAVEQLERQGIDAGRMQLSKNGIALVALILPACVGLWLTSPLIAAVLVGPEFRVGVAALIPIVSATAFLSSVRHHFVDHAFHLTGQPLLMVWVYAPTALCSIVLNLSLIPRYGVFGAAYAALICQAGALVASWIMAERHLPPRLPVSEVIKTALAVVPMAAVLKLMTFPFNVTGLLLAVGLGGACYAASAATLNLDPFRSVMRDVCRFLAARAR